MKKDSNSSIWKVVAITFISLFVIENLIFVWAYFDTEKDSKYESICITQYCSTSKFDAYSYDVDTQICSCLKDNKIMETHRIE